MKFFTRFFWACCTLAASQSFAVSKSFIAIVDAGSTGSRIHVYAYNKPQDTHTIAQLTEIFMRKVKPGLSSYAGQPQKAGASLQDLLTNAQAAITRANGSPSATPLYLLATAGMRQLPEKSQQAIYSDVKSTLAKFRFVVKKVETISGEREGVYDWIAVNSENNSLLSSQTLGALDMGGASAEIAYMERDQSVPAFNFTLADQKFRVVSNSTMHLGMDDAQKSAPKFGDVSVCYPTDYQIPNTTKRGAFDFDRCSRLIGSELDQFKLPEQLPHPRSDESFVAFSGYFYVFSYFKAGSSIEKLAANTQQVCESQTWSQLVANNPKLDPMYISKYCFDGAFLTALLSKHSTGYRFSADTTHILVADTLNHEDIDWPQGAALYFISGEGLTA